MRNKYATLWIWMCLCPLALDYKAPDGDSGHAAQILLVAPTLAAALALALIAPRFRHGSMLRAFVAFCLLLSVPGSIVAQLVQDNDAGNYLRVLLPFLLFLLGYTMACHPWHEQRIAQIEKALYWANLICLVFTFVFGMATGGGLAEVRFRIVSVTLLGLQGVLLHEFVVARRFSVFTMLVFLGTVVVELLSVTRSLLVGTALLFAIAAWMSAPSLRHVLRATMRVAATGLAVAAMAGLAAWLFPSVTEHWAQRLFVAEATTTGKDPTTITRLAEMRDQYDQVTASTESLLLGQGYGHYYRYSPAYLPDLEGQISEKEFYAIHEWAAGHNFWVYQLFAGGILFGVGLPLAVIVALYRCCLAHRRWRTIAPGTPLLPAFGRSILLLAALPATSIGGNPLGPRFSGLVFGVALGLMIALHSQLQRQLEANGHRTKRAATMRPRSTVPERIEPTMPPLPALRGEPHPGIGGPGAKAPRDYRSGGLAPST